MKKRIMALMCASLCAFSLAASAADGTATLPLSHSSASGDSWKNADLNTLPGWTSTGLATPYSSGNGAGKFDTSGDNFVIAVDGAMGEITASLKVNNGKDAGSADMLFEVLESADGETFSQLASYSEALPGADFSVSPAAASRFIKFVLTTKVSGKNVSIDNLNIAAGGPRAPSVSFDRPDNFEVAVNLGGAVTATLNDYESDDIYWVWTSSPVEFDDDWADEDTLTIPANSGLASDTYELEAEAWETGVDDPIASAVIHVVVVPERVAYSVTIADDILNGTLSADRESAFEGETVTFTATPDPGYKLDAISVNGASIAGNTYVMEDGNIYASASFVEKGASEGFTLITSMEELEEGDYVITSTAAEKAMTSSNSGTTYLYATAEALPVTDDTISTEDETIIWHIAPSGGTWTIYNAALAKYVQCTGTKTQIKLADEAEGFSVTCDGGGFKFLSAKLDNAILQYNSSNPRFTFYTSAQKPLKLYKGSSTPAALSVSIDNPAVSVQVGTAASITATAKGGAAPYSYAWTGDLTGSDATLAIPDTLAVGSYAVTVTVTDDEGATASASAAITVTDTPPPPPAGDYTLVTEGPLAAGIYVITASRSDGEFGMCAELTDGGTKRLVADKSDIAIDGDTLSTEDARIIWTLVEDGGNFKLYNEAADKYVTWTAKNNANLGNADAAASYEVSVNDGLWTFASTYSTNSGALQMNNTAGNNYFAHYSGANKKLRLWAGSTGPAALSVSIDNPAISVALGTAASITATAKGGAAPYSFAWTGDLTGSDATLAIPDTLAVGSYAVTVTVTDDEGATASADATITVTDTPPPPPAGDYTLVTEGPLAAGIYVITASRSDGEFGMCAELTDGGTKRLVADKSDIVIDGDTLSTEDARIIWTLVEDGENFKLYNEAADKYVTWTAKNNANLGNADAAASYEVSVNDGLWTFASTYSTNSGALQMNNTAGNDYFAHYAGANKKLRLWVGSTGPAALSVSISPASASIGVGATATFTATVKNGAGDISYAWTLNGDAVGSDSATYTTAGDLAEGAYIVEVTATDGEGATASASAALTVAGTPPPPPGAPIIVFDGSDTATVGSETLFTATLIDYEPLEIGSLYVISATREGQPYEDYSTDLPQDDVLEVSFTPDEKGTYTFAIYADFSDGSVTPVQSSFSVVVTDGEEPSSVRILSISHKNGQLTIETDAESTASVALSAADAVVDGAWNWEQIRVIPAGSSFVIDEETDYNVFKVDPVE